jgi:hypothetical protein
LRTIGGLINDDRQLRRSNCVKWRRWLWCKKGDMKNFMNHHGGRKFQVVCNRIYDFHNLEGAKLLCFQFSTGMTSLDIAAVKENKISNKKRWGDESGW